MILTCRQILNNLEQLVHTGKIYAYLCLYKDKKLQEILNPEVGISEKRRILINRLEELLESKRLSERARIAEDNINLYPSWNQRHY